MRYTKGSLIGQKGLRLVYGSWLPDEAPAALVFVVHGKSEHIGRYAHLIQALVQRGYAVYGVDHRGHGESDGLRCHVERFDHFVEDVHLVVRKAKSEHPGLPMFMVAHSMGGLIATRYALAHQPELAGLVLSGAALHIGDNISPFLKYSSAALAFLVPTLPITASSKEIESVLSRDPEVQALWDKDPLCYNGKLRARFGYELLRASRNTVTRLAELTLPLLIMHGTADKLTNPVGSTHLYKTARSTDKTLKLWDDCRHEIFNELNKVEVIALTCDWLDEHLRRLQPDLTVGSLAGSR